MGSNLGSRPFPFYVCVLIKHVTNVKQRRPGSEASRVIVNDLRTCNSHILHTNTCIYMYIHVVM